MSEEAIQPAGEPKPHSESSVRRTPSQHPSTVAILALVVSLASFLASAVNVYLTQIRRPKIEVLTGPEIEVYYPQDGGFAMYVPFGFVNSAARGGSILRVRLVIERWKISEEFGEGAHSESFEFEWAGFGYQDPVTRKFLVVEAGPIAVPGGSAVSKLVWFVWRPDSAPYFILNPGTYTLQFQVWTSQNKKPDQVIVQDITVDPVAADRMLERRVAADPLTEDFTFNGMSPENSYSGEDPRE